MTKQKNINYLLEFSHFYDDERKGADDELWVDCFDITECGMYCLRTAEKTIGERIDSFGIHGIHYIRSQKIHLGAYETLFYVGGICRNIYNIENEACHMII